jgi:hypothetical protein
MVPLLGGLPALPSTQCGKGAPRAGLAGYSPNREAAAGDTMRVTLDVLVELAGLGDDPARRRSPALWAER